MPPNRIQLVQCHHKEAKRYCYHRVYATEGVTQQKPSPTSSNIANKNLRAHHSIRVCSWLDTDFKAEPIASQNTKEDDKFMGNFINNYKYDPIKNRTSFKMKVVSSFDYSEFRSSKDPTLKKLRWQHFNFVRSQCNAQYMSDFEPTVIIPSTGIHDDTCRLKWADIKCLQSEFGRTINPDTIQYIHRWITTPHCY